MKKNRLKTYLEDPFLADLMSQIRTAGAMKSSLLDITNKCNLRCVGCYYFAEGMDRHQQVKSDEEFYRFVEQERARGTNLLTIVGGEPALEVERIKILARHFKLMVVTNGTIPIPVKGLENIHIAISFWGDERQDMLLRGDGKRNVFDTSLENYRNDERVGFYYTTVPGFVDGIEQATDKIVENGNFVVFNFYGDLANKGGRYSHKNGFDSVIRRISDLIEKYPERVISSPHINETISTRKLFDQSWGYDVCPSVTFDHPQNAGRMKNGKKYPTAFRAYNADLTTRRCCIGSDRDCDTCTDLWAIYGWVIGSMREHLVSRKAFSDWLCTMYIFYMQTGFIDVHTNVHRLPEIYRRFNRQRRYLRSDPVVSVHGVAQPQGVTANNLELQ